MNFSVFFFFSAHQNQRILPEEGTVKQVFDISKVFSSACQMQFCDVLTPNVNEGGKLGERKASGSLGVLLYPV